MYSVAGKVSIPVAISHRSLELFLELDDNPL